MKIKSYKSHIFAIFALFVMGNTVITLPFCTQENGLSVLLTSALFCLIFTALSVLGLNYAFLSRVKKSIAQSVSQKIIGGIVVAAVLLAAIYGAASTIGDYILFLKSVQLPQTSIIFTATAMLLLIIVFAKSPDSAILKLSLFLAVISGVSLVLMFLASIKIFDTSALNFKLNLGGGTITKGFKLFLKNFSQILVPAAFVAVTKKRAEAKPALSGAAVGLVGIALCAVQSILVLGGMVSGREFSYLYAVSAISAGRLFIRQDGFVYLIFFSTAIIKTALCVKTVLIILKRFSKNKNAEDV